uniref:Hydroxysteroid dehydrogenase-like protein 2 n=1 Tax=Anopheles farauti TaxID=69004 RepID=A0A182R048_9DIPT
MQNTGKLAGLTLFITGASRGIGKAIALKAARDGANIVLAAKTAEPHPKLPGTIYTAAAEVEAAGGKALPCIVDVRSKEAVRAAVQKAVRTFGGIDIVINNASAISLTSTETTDMKRYDLMHNINTRGTFLVSKECLPYLRESKHAHILNISPPLYMQAEYFSNHVAYTMAKYGMSMCVLGMAREYESAHISVNALWPRMIVYTAAVEMLRGQESYPFSRKPEIMADAAYAILSRPPGACTGKFYMDEEVLEEEGIKDFTQYANVPGITLFITGASRGIGKAIALKAARDGANIVLAAKTTEPHPKLPGTIYTAAAEVEAAGGKALPCIVDVRSEEAVRAAVQKAVRTFGGIDIVINNASAISLTPTEETDMKRYDLMHNINTRGTFLVSRECLPYLRKSKHAHILNISPPLNMEPHWFSNHVAYTMAKYGMSMCVLGMAREYENANISVNALWPRTIIFTAAVEMLHGQEGHPFSRKPEIMADAAYAILCRTPGKNTGNFFIDDEVLSEEGITDFTQYACVPENAHMLTPDIFVNEKKSKL